MEHASQSRGEKALITMLRQGLLLEEATDMLWTLTSYDLYRVLVRECHWPPERYETWLAQARWMASYTGSE